MKKYENFCRSYANLAEAIVLEPPYNTVTLTGLVGLFEIVFEQSWKMMKEILEYNGYSGSSTDSPRTILKTAYQAGMINDEAVWLKALAARNNVTHSYNKEIAMAIIMESKQYYVGMFAELKETVEREWLDGLMESM